VPIVRRPLDQCSSPAFKVNWAQSGVRPRPPVCHGPDTPKSSRVEPGPFCPWPAIGTVIRSDALQKRGNRMEISRPVNVECLKVARFRVEPHDDWPWVLVSRRGFPGESRALAGAAGLPAMTADEFVTRLDRPDPSASS
jgi:hypothetical protein